MSGVVQLYRCSPIQFKLYNLLPRKTEVARRFNKINLAKAIMANLRINYTQIKEKIERYSFKKAAPIATKLAKQEFIKRKEQFLEDFALDPVNQEIAAGEKFAGSIGDQGGNLFAYLGFNKGDHPIEDLYDYLDKSIKLIRGFTYNKSTKKFTFKYSIPTMDDIKRETPSPDEWYDGLSWVAAIQNGIPGLKYFYYNADDPKQVGKESRSGTGIQRKNPIRAGSNNTKANPAYIAALLKELNKK